MAQNDSPRNGLFSALWYYNAYQSCPYMGNYPIPGISQLSRDWWKEQSTEPLFMVIIPFLHSKP
jgi:hypothetical protein